MKAITFTIILMLVFLCLTGCKDNSPKEEASTPSAVSEDVSVDYEKEAAKVYKFLHSKYSVTALRSVHGIEYRYDYYFQKGVVAGLKQSVTLLDPDSAEIYYNEVADDCPQAYIDGTTVVHYIGDDASCYGFSLERLEFQLEHAEYNYTVNFDRDTFLERYNTSDISE